MENTQHSARVLVLGAYGFIGLAVAHRLQLAGHELLCVGRSVQTGQRLLPNAQWLGVDIASLLTADAWRDIVKNIDVVVNASGALQSGLQDKLEAIHHTAIAALVEACQINGVSRFVQVSAVGVNHDASTEFMRSKARGDACLKSSSLNWIILKPGLVIGPNAYGGTALLRMLASIPVVQPLVYGDRLVQTVALSDVARVVHDAVDGKYPAGTEMDLVENDTVTLDVLLKRLRAWLGITPAQWTITVPASLAKFGGKIADGLGRLGWRSPMRTTTMQVLSEGITGNAQKINALNEAPLSSLDVTLASFNSTLQDRWFARMYVLLPIVVAVLAIFWVLSGAIALFNVEAATVQSGLPPSVGRFAVIAGAGIDILLGLFVLFRPWSQRICWAMIAVSLVYLLMGSWLRPDLWTDPLGPFVKILPAMLLALVAVALLDEHR